MNATIKTVHYRWYSFMYSNSLNLKEIFTPLFKLETSYSLEPSRLFKVALAIFKMFLPTASRAVKDPFPVTHIP